MTNFYTHIHTTLAAQADEPLLIWPGEDGQPPLCYTGRQILQKISAFRALLKKVQPGEKVLLLLPVGMDMVCALLAVQGMGAVPVLPPARPSVKQLLRIVFSQRVKALVIKKQRTALWPLLLSLTGRQLVSASHLVEDPTQWPTVAVAAEQPALVTHTSGSGGQPKAICRSHGVLTAQHQALKAVFPPWPHQRDYPLFPNIILHNLACGTTSILPHIPGFRLEAMEPPLIVEQMQKHRVQTLTGNVYYFRRLAEYLQAHPQDIPSVRALGIGGSPVAEPLLRTLQQLFPGAALYVIYGSSEAEPIAVRRAGERSYNPLQGYAVGPVYGGLQVRIDAMGTVTTPSGIEYPTGEIIVRGAHVATAAKDGWHPTGDYGYLGPDGQLYLTARKGNEAIRHGMQHYQVEHLLLHLPGVEGAAARPAEKGFTVYVQGAVEKADLKDLLEAHLPPGVISDIRMVKQLPLDGRHHSKVLYEKLSVYAI